MVENVKQHHEENPTDPIILIGHSYGGDTVMLAADQLGQLMCSCLYVVTLDPVSRNNEKVQNESYRPPVREWVHVYQPGGIADNVVDVPFVGRPFGWLYVGLGGIFKTVVHVTISVGTLPGQLANLVTEDLLGIVDLPEIPQEEIPWNNIVATGGGQWNEMESPTYSVPTQTDHNSTSGMLLEKIEVDGITMTIRNYIDELKRRKCGE